jgi:heat shock transcription factor
LDVNSLVTGISAIKRHQQAISADLSELKTSNQHLWQEAMAARERHKKHQDTINRILKFLASVFGHSAASPVHKHNDSDSSHPVIPRKRQRLMIAGGSKEKSKGVSVADEIDEDDLMSEVENQTPSSTFFLPPTSALFNITNFSSLCKHFITFCF